jgi:hypothetical protein
LNCNEVLLDQSEIEAFLFCRVCREYFAFEKNAFHIHRQSARHLKGKQTSAGNSSTWHEHQVAQNDEPTTPSATTESAASIATASSAPTSLLQPAITDTFSLTTTGDASRENSAPSGVQFDVAGTNPVHVNN